jgi:hypothetical protein
MHLMRRREPLPSHYSTMLCPRASAFPTYSTNASLNVQEVKAGIKFKFGP